MPMAVGIYTGWVREKDYAEQDVCSGGPNWQLELINDEDKVIVKLGTRAEGTIFEPFVGKKICVRISLRRDE